MFTTFNFAGARATRTAILTGSIAGALRRTLLGALILPSRFLGAGDAADQLPMKGQAANLIAGVEARLLLELKNWGGSSAGRALRSQCRGREFDPHPLHHHNVARLTRCVEYALNMR